jgi:hypothetical protein
VKLVSWPSPTASNLQGFSSVTSKVSQQLPAYFRRDHDVCVVALYQWVRRETIYPNIKRMMLTSHPISRWLMTDDKVHFTKLNPFYTWRRLRLRSTPSFLWKLGEVLLNHDFSLRPFPRLWKLVSIQVSWWQGIGAKYVRDRIKYLWSFKLFTHHSHLILGPRFGGKAV